MVCYYEWSIHTKGRSIHIIRGRVTWVGNEGVMIDGGPYKGVSVVFGIPIRPLTDMGCKNGHDTQMDVVNILRLYIEWVVRGYIYCKQIDRSGGRDDWWWDGEKSPEMHSRNLKWFLTLLVDLLYQSR